MKKMYLVLIAVVMAVGFSAFSTATAKTDDEITYRDDEGFWHNFQGQPCLGDEVPECFKLTPDGFKQLFYNNNPESPVYDYDN